MPEELIPEARDLVARILEDDPERPAARESPPERKHSSRRCRHRRQTPGRRGVATHDIGYGSQLRDSGFTRSTRTVYLRGKAGPVPSATLSRIIQVTTLRRGYSRA